VVCDERSDMCVESVGYEVREIGKCWTHRFRRAAIVSQVNHEVVASQSNEPTPKGLWQ
jgi:hypothetical protein